MRLNVRHIGQVGSLSTVERKMSYFTRILTPQKSLGNGPQWSGLGLATTIAHRCIALEKEKRRII